MPTDGFLLLIASIAGGITLGVVGRRWLDRGTVQKLAQQSEPFEVSFYMPYKSWQVIGTVATLFASDASFSLHDPKQRVGLRLSKWLGFGQLQTDDPRFNDDFHAEGDRVAASAFFSSAARRDAARAVFRHGFFAIKHRHRLATAYRKGKVPADVAAAVKPHVIALGSTEV